MIEKSGKKLFCLFVVKLFYWTQTLWKDSL